MLILKIRERPVGRRFPGGCIPSLDRPGQMSPNCVFWVFVFETHQWNFRMLIIIIVSNVVIKLCTSKAILWLSINVTVDKLWKCMPIHACVLLPIIKDQPMGQQYSGGCIPSFDSPGAIHIKCYLSLWFWASPIKILDPINDCHDL